MQIGEAKHDRETRLNRRLSVAPMLDWTDRYCRYFLRLISSHVLLYTEMVTTGAILHGNRARFLDFDPSEHPVALQLGGSEPEALAQCAKLGEQWGYDEINLNVGCPSDRVQSGRFGACLMLTPELVADCVKAMRDQVTIDVTVKHRIGVDDQDSYQALCDFVGKVSEAGCETFIVHARKAWLQGLSPKENREIPPLHYETVHQLKRDYPDLQIIINGGITTLEQVEENLKQVDGVMIGREAYNNPWILSQADSLIYASEGSPASRHQIIEAMIPYIDQELSAGTPINRITRHILGLFQGLPGAKKWRRMLSEEAHKAGADSSLILRAAAQVVE
ncbi:MAG: tRNA dihydrouridine(20/20a) synthase DusA [Candidatus Thiodiazotropha taylori]|uniref:tRNA-dihydrouridine(20/20a) synthase n=1 Tax=Candidatus Thiodiazotropha taylori TaxID=2792791 RepID=A0A9E4KAL7_9GAMM|nr:tRNA dihydrouridine(20/20a) synthase DusA [Candidatus Thiodiazotropha taylori]MCG8029853.1 tRNA dihydrouridine(20/20a) synthase DusA [Candidatus Thiodiazotropha taylori]MCG8106295.1 tRNA dihydrouridine(20/20a) synthase DusA [Candidatus Thiodiazotropha taylori]MCG8110397.1 tRNA dihydrouridine(20/20a) synthase DusA [Candidatus Thiodiazotropha taylori]MCW4255283.1 tRNA dihydrouridine(20/20a) synthase DusA [Candidatus Thiodiazotropha taylori]